ncbi:MAG: HPr family phosphocarrier protein [Alphaproteobacteria bacterium]|nr:HPr family phosphocarrier protein [Alphaproteobacteria bacterium]MBF0128973.1 HPr family phosphocarrier protein [Alphaproteobacteria bacterium]
MDNNASSGIDADIARGSATIANRLGLHARAAAKFVKLAANYRAEIVVSHKGQEADGRSIMGLMMLAAGIGCVINLRATGQESWEAVAALTRLVNEKFGEE